MEETYRSRLAALDRTWQLWAELGAGLTERQWSNPTRCPGWDVAAVFAHHGETPRHLDAPLPGSDAAGEPLPAAEIIRRFNAAGGIAHTMAEPIADQAVEIAARLPRTELVDRFGVHAPRAVDRLRASAPDLVVPWGEVGVVRAVEALRIVLLEAVVHLFDAQRALGRPAAAPAAALRDTACLLAEVAPAVELIEAATGRSAVSPLPVLR